MQRRIGVVGGGLREVGGKRVKLEEDFGRRDENITVLSNQDREEAVLCGWGV